jgi:hypothetical protein
MLRAVLRVSSCLGATLHVLTAKCSFKGGCACRSCVYGRAVLPQSAREARASTLSREVSHMSAAVARTRAEPAAATAAEADRAAEALDLQRALMSQMGWTVRAGRRVGCGSIVCVCVAGEELRIVWRGAEFAWVHVWSACEGD